MRAAVVTGPGTVEILDVAEPEAVPGSVVVEVAACGLGGSDREAARHGDPPAPGWFGHEWSGRVIAVGDGVDDRFVGERVVGSVPPPCGRCSRCRAGLVEHCERVLASIVGTEPLASPHGGFAPRIRVAGDRLTRVPEGVDDVDATFAAPAAVSARALARAGQVVGSVVAVVGAGTIGVLAVELARLAGAARILAVEHDRVRAELACDLGADAAMPPGPGAVEWLADQGHGLGADVVLDCAGLGGRDRPEVPALVRHGGVVVVVGRGGVTALDPDVLVTREVTVRGSVGFGAVDMNRTLALMAEDRLRPGRLIGPTVGLDEVPARALDPEAVGRVIVDPSR